MKIEVVRGAHEGERTARRADRYGLHYCWHIKGKRSNRTMRDLYVLLPDGFDVSKIRPKFINSRWG